MFVKSRSVTSLLVTGSWLSIVSVQFVRNFRIPMRSSPEDHCILKSAGGDFLNVCGKVTLNLSMNHLSMSHEFGVVDNLTLTALIGCEVMYKFNVVIYFVNQNVSFMGGLDCEQLLNQSNDLRETVRINNYVTLKPYTETIVRVSWPRAYRCKDPVVLEPMSRDNKQQFGTARVVVLPTGRTTICKVCNATADTITLKPSTPLATIERIYTNAITVMESVDKTEARTQEEREMEWSRLEKMGTMLDN